MTWYGIYRQIKNIIDKALRVHIGNQVCLITHTLILDKLCLILITAAVVTC